MADIFISYARPNERHAKLAAEALRAAGYSVWRDDELPAHRAYSEVIEERIRAAKAVLVLWSADATRSQWVRAEADAAREAGTLVQISLDGVLPPMPFNQIQCADLAGWNGETGTPGWQKVVSSVASLAGTIAPVASPREAVSETRRAVICVVPLVNMSGDAQQEYFSDGISEDIIIDLSKVSALTVIARNVAFSLKGSTLDVPALARDLGVTHVIEGSVRKAGERVRITAQLIDCANSHQLWGDRYDRDLTDIFAIQDEISKAIVAALKLTLLPKEKKAIENRGTSEPEAYNLYLLARQHWIKGNVGDRRRDEVVIRICRQATAMDPNYAKAWALMALAQSELRFWYGRTDDGMPAAETARALDPNLPEVYCVLARSYQNDGNYEEANRQLALALRLGPDSWEVNKETAHLTFRQGRIRDAIPYFEKACALVDTDYHDANMLLSCYAAVGDNEGLMRAARMALARVEREVAQDPSNGAAMSMGAGALATLGDTIRAKEWIKRALLLDPENISMRYNLACTMVMQLKEFEAAIDLLVPYFEEVSLTQLRHCAVDPDMDPVRGDARFQSMVETALDRLGVTRDMLPGEGRALSSV